MPVSEELILDWVEMAALLGLTPRLDANGMIVPIGKPERGRKKKVYVVWVGRAIGIFMNW